MKRIVFRWLKLVILVYCLAGIVVYYAQDKILFKPKVVSHAYNFGKEVNIPFSANSTINIVQFPVNPSKGVVLYFHGNKENIERYAPAAPQFNKRGYEVWMIDYPGFGKSTGEFTEQRLYDWAMVFYRLARAKYGADSIILYGKSLGTGIAAQLATRVNSKALILEGPYYSIPSIFASWAPIYPWENMIKFKIPTGEYLKQVSVPVTIFHGTSDYTIPYWNAKKLSCNDFVTIEGGAHNNLSTFPLYQQKLDSLLR